MIKVYIASPYAIGDQATNVRRQIDMADRLIEAGFCPFVPLFTHFQHMFYPRHIHEWMAQDLEWVKTCDVLLRLPGESKGADQEERYAVSLGKPAFHSFEELVAWATQHKGLRLETQPGDGMSSNIGS